MEDNQNVDVQSIQNGAEYVSSTPRQYKEYSTEDKLLCAVSHLAYFSVVGYFFAPLIIWLLKKDTSPFVAEHAKQAMIWQGGLFVASSILSMVTSAFVAVTLGLGGFLVLFMLPVFFIICLALFVPSFMAVKAVLDEKNYSYPVLGQYADRF